MGKVQAEEQGNEKLTGKAPQLSFIPLHSGKQLRGAAFSEFLCSPKYATKLQMYGALLARWATGLALGSGVRGR